MRTHAGREWTGPAGSAIEIVIDEVARPDQLATVASWFLTCPGQSPAWDEAAVELLDLAVRAVLDGRLWAEAPLSGQVEPWRTVLIKTSAHARGEEHAP